MRKTQNRFLWELLNYQEKRVLWGFLLIENCVFPSFSLLAMRCPHCKKPDSIHAPNCVQGRYSTTSKTFARVSSKPQVPTAVQRIVFCAGVILFVVLGFYFSLIISAEALEAEEHAKIDRAIEILDKSGFTAEAFYLRNFAAFRGSDNWLNSSVAKESAYAATNFPFAVITVYPDFFTYTADDTERAAILLHESVHLQGGDESEAYSMVWKRKKELGWTEDRYADSIVWQEIRKQTAEYVPNLFVCEFKQFNDCSE
jgi:beta-lactamase regulating signal transducer with metallopeptidase domain